MDRRLPELVRDRAGDRCEYCRLRQAHYRPWRHQVEHILPRKHGRTDDEGNLAWSCIRCDLGKSSNLPGIDDAGTIVPLFNPRTDPWDEHFAFNGPEIVGLTPTGRATVALLNMNEDERLRLRAEPLLNGELD